MEWGRLRRPGWREMRAQDQDEGDASVPSPRPNLSRPYGFDEASPQGPFSVPCCISVTIMGDASVPSPRPNPSRPYGFNDATP